MTIITPSFGDIVQHGFKDGPQRSGIFVREQDECWLMTDGSGAFWLTPSSRRVSGSRERTSRSPLSVGLAESAESAAAAVGWTVQEYVRRTVITSLTAPRPTIPRPEVD